MIIEYEGVNEVRKILNRTGYLVSYIDENDKTPIWDGSILVYEAKGNQHSNDNLIGRVSVQVKGKNVRELPTGEMKYSVRLVDLRSFNTEGGAIFFVVYITDDYNSKIYYSNLLSIDIERILKKHSHQKEVSIKFSPFPHDTGTIMSIFLSFLANRKIQTGTVNTKKLYFEEWNNPEDQRKIEKYKIPITIFNEPGKLPFEMATTIPQYIYISPKDFENVMIPIDRMEKIAIGYEEKGSIKIAEKEYYDKYKIIWKEGNFSFHYGKGLSVSFTKIVDQDKNIMYKAKLDIVVKGTLKQRIKDLEFFINLYDKKNFSIKSMSFPMNTNDINLEEVNYFKDIYKSLCDLQIKLNTLEVTEDLELDKVLSNEIDEKWKLDLLLQIGEEPQQYTEDENESVFRILKIANVRILMIALYENNKQSFLDFYTPCVEMKGINTDDNSEEIYMSQYVVLKQDELTASNFKYQIVFDDIIKYEPVSYYLNQVNLFLLEVIKAYDLNEGKNCDLYRLSISLSEWLISKDDNTLFFMNYLQVIKRNTNISKDDQLSLQNMMKNNENNWEITTGIFILLGNKEKALEVLDLQEPKDQSNFKNYPINNLLTNY